MFQHLHNLPLYRIGTDRPNKWNVHFHATILFPYKKKKRQLKLFLNKKAKGLDSAFKDEHAMHLMGTGVGLVT